jgi:hypothetical protein
MIIPVTPTEPPEYQVYVVDEARVQQFEFIRHELGDDNAASSGVFVRAKRDGKWGSHDVIELTAESFVRFLRSRGEVSDWAVNMALILGGYPPEERPE